jgi:putative membrane protein
MNTTAEHSGRFEVRITSDSHFGWIRTRMALERTLMAWVRTGLSLIGFGFTIVQFFQRLNDMQGVAPALRPQAPRNMGLALIAAGVFALFVSGWQYRRLVKYLWSNDFKPLAGMDSTGMHPVYSQSPLLAVLIGVIVIGLFAFFAVLLRMV